MRERVLSRSMKEGKVYKKKKTGPKGITWDRSNKKGAKPI